MSCRILSRSRESAAIGPLSRYQEVGEGPHLGPPDPAAQLVELGEPEGVGTVDDQGVGARNVEPGFDDGGAEQQVRLAMHEAEHHLLQLPFLHLAVGHGDFCLRNDPGQMFRHDAD